ncbi:MAG: hypothetical protein HKN13_13475 [Rhodothermales bacterium]|nr:hypothetical protein [Rhodothermales bacterium]
MFALVRNIESLENSNDPLHRIIRINEDHFSFSVATTSERIGRRIAEAIANITQSSITTRVDEGVEMFVVA